MEGDGPSRDAERKDDGALQYKRMLSKEQRLGARDISRIRKTGKTFSKEGYVFWWTPSETPKFRCAVAATGTAGRNAVVRNRTRRVVFAALEKEKTILQNTRFDILIICRKELHEKNAQKEAKSVIRQAVEIMGQNKKHDTKNN